ncbi:hypothetical protein [Fictibacillus phosphorivorans]|uniref:hypothetical protein n=1 Tax=Fictibacillus phosphorivorans TaxID=1221500 RepID=UPI002041D7A8|nr:hypothetical protein [Fictibacillus phosphorivorans]MCM3718131.1 hypothetical protein [Fictibacillus phosphorivorans]MCM3775758.1 hypothetical protein [Fictibacillus phosphorivorans]
MKDYFIRLTFSMMTMIIIYGIFYMLGLHAKSWAPFIILPLGLAGGYGSLYFYKIILEQRKQYIK